MKRIIKKHKYNYKNKLPNHIIKQKFKLKNVYNSYLKYYENDEKYFCNVPVYNESKVVIKVIKELQKNLKILFV